MDCHPISFKSMKYAAIDIGSNTILLLVAEISNRSIRTLYEEQRTPRLGKKVDTDKNLHPDSVRRAIEDLEHFKQVIDNHFPKVEKVVVTATSAVRDASNSNEFIDDIRQRTGFEVGVLSGREEAECTYLGALSVLKNISNTVAIIDIGGGSTEISLGRGKEMIDSHSYNMGSVRFTERYLKDEPPTVQQLNTCRKAIQKEFQEKELPVSRASTLVGVAGTVTSLALINAGLDVYRPANINGSHISMNQLQDWIHRISDRGSEWLLGGYPNVMEGRADVFLGGLLILEGFMIHAEFSRLKVSTGGIRHGALLKILLK